MNAPELEVDVVEAAGHVLVVLRGELDVHGHVLAEQGLRRAAATRQPVVLDLRFLDFVDSSGLLLVLTWHRRLHTRFSVVRGPDHVQRPFVSAGLVELLPFVDGPPA